MIEHEKKELDLLLGNGPEIKVNGRSFSMQRMNLGRILKIARLAIEMDVDEDALQSGDVFEVTKAQFNSVVSNAHNNAKIVAVAVTKNYRDDAATDELTEYLLDNMTSAELLEVSKAILTQSDLSNFMLSTFLMNGNRITQAGKVED